MTRLALGRSWLPQCDAAAYRTNHTCHASQDNLPERARLAVAGNILAPYAFHLKGPALDGESGVGPMRAWPGGLCVSRTVGDGDVGPAIVPVPHVRQVRGRCLEGAWRVLGRCLEGAWKLSGRCSMCRCLCISRTVGDGDVGPAIVPEPHVRQILAPKHGCRVIIASDGLWDVITPSEAARLTRKQTASQAVRELTKAAASDRARVIDDTSVICVDLIPGSLPSNAAWPDTYAHVSKSVPPRPPPGMFQCCGPTAEPEPDSRDVSGVGQLSYFEDVDCLVAYPRLSSPSELTRTSFVPREPSKNPIKAKQQEMRGPRQYAHLKDQGAGARGKSTEDQDQGVRSKSDAGFNLRPSQLSRPGTPAEIRVEVLANGDSSTDASQRGFNRGLSGSVDPSGSVDRRGSVDRPGGVDRLGSMEPSGSVEPPGSVELSPRVQTSRFGDSRSTSLSSLPKVAEALPPTRSGSRQL
ncbi:hypothetical protein FOA52_002985 [Chlamydomonas sp. UWO 241]|nr:hypothetical protein FOA52_002985 [Chlamydomonas sp. UWO 241]